MRWKKIGQIFNPSLISKLGLTAALMPMVEILNESEDRARVYFSPRDHKNRSELHYFDIDLKKPEKILAISSRKIFGHGKTGAFDDSGVTPGNIVNVGNKKLFYYTGWNLTQSVPFNNSIGVAEQNNTGDFVRLGDGPIMTRTLFEPYSCASPFVLFEMNRYRMWYASMDKWEPGPEGLKHYYNIKYAESLNGVNWVRKGKIAINYKNNTEYAFGRPFVMKEGGFYKMWYSFRGAAYRIGYAESKDGLDWIRKDSKAGITVSSKGWDSDMIEYPYILTHKKVKYMFYNGNGYGKTGIGLAKLITAQSRI